MTGGLCTELEMGSEDDTATMFSEWLIYAWRVIESMRIRVGRELQDVPLRFEPSLKPGSVHLSD